MRALILAFLLAPALAFGQAFPDESEGAAAFDGGTITTPLILPNGAVGAPALTFTNLNTSGWYLETATPGSILAYDLAFGIDGEERQTWFRTAATRYMELRNPANTAGAANQNFVRYLASASSNSINVNQPGQGGWGMSLGGGSATGGYLTLGAFTVGNTINFGYSDTLTNKIRFETNFLGTTYTDLVPATPSGANTITIPAATGTIALSGAALALPDGSAGSPALYFSTDTDTGIFHEADSEINFTSNGVEIFDTGWSGTRIDHRFLNPANSEATKYGVSIVGVSNNNQVYVHAEGSATGYASLGSSSVVGSGLSLDAGATGNYIYFHDTDTLGTSGIYFETNGAFTDYTHLKVEAPSGVNTVTIPADTGTVALLVASDALTFNPGSTASGACAAAITDTATGTATTDVISWTFAADPTSTTGYDPSGDVGYIVSYPTANTVSFKFCNKSGSAIDPGSVTLNWRVAR